MDFEAKYAKAKKRLITLEYDGVLVPTQVQPGLTIPDHDIKTTVGQLAADSGNTVMILSGREREHLDLHWSRRNLILVAEHGAAHRNRSDEWSSFFETFNGWIEETEQILKPLVFQFGGSFIERCRYSIKWHYGSIVDRISASEIRQVLAAIRAMPNSEYFKIYQPYRCVELRSRGLSHPGFIRTWIGQQSFDFILTIGVDESSFPVLDLSNPSIPVTLTIEGNGRSTKVLDSQSEVIQLLGSLLGTSVTKKLGIWPFR